VASFPDRWQAFAKIVTAMLACNLTRVAVLQFSNSHQEASGSTDWVSFPAVKGHSWHHVSHNDAAGQAALQSAFMQNMLVPLVKALQGLKEADGSSLLDSTLVAWQTEFITGDDHSGAYIPTVFAGGRKAWKTGTTVKVADGTAHNAALVSMLRFMGFPDATFGAAGTGALPGLGA
jgi:hypothetical protein